MNAGTAREGYGDIFSAALLTELGHSAAFGSVMEMEEAQKWSWKEIGDAGFNSSLNELLRMGRVIEKDGRLTLGGMQHLFEHSERRKMAAEDRLRFGQSFIRKIGSQCPELLLGGVSGSVSYNSSGPDDDVDILLITEDGSLWKVLADALIEARRIRKTNPDAPILCLSYCMEETAFRSEALSHRSRLFARDFLRLKAETGLSLYRKILRDSSWMRTFYPAMFDERSCQEFMESEERRTERSRSLNTLYYVSIGGYLSIAAMVRNHAFRREGKRHKEFRARIRRDRCIYESLKWKRLEKSFEEENVIK